MADVEKLLVQFADALVSAADQHPCDCGFHRAVREAAADLSLGLQVETSPGVYAITTDEMTNLRVRIRSGELTSLTPGQTYVLRLLQATSDICLGTELLTSLFLATKQQKYVRPRQLAMWLIYNDPRLRINLPAICCLFDKAIATTHRSIQQVDAWPDTSLITRVRARVRVKTQASA